MSNYEKILIVFDGTSWFVRRVCVSTHDLERDEMVYRCDTSTCTERVGFTKPFGTAFYEKDGSWSWFRSV